MTNETASVTAAVADQGDPRDIPSKNELGYRRYDHVARIGHSDVEAIGIGRVFVFPKLDGTNAVAWTHEGQPRFGSRNRIISLEADNQGFYEWAMGEDAKAVALRATLAAHPTWILYGEWMVPHTLKTYRPDTWKRLWLFDVFDTERGRYVPYDDYAPVLVAAGLDVIEPLCIITDPTQDQLVAQLEANTYLMQDGAGPGEGIVAKNYGWQNRYGRQPWAKVVRAEFREDNARAFGVTEKTGGLQVEAEIVRRYVTPTLVGKTRAKVVEDLANKHGVDLTQPNAQKSVEENHRGVLIPQLLGRVFHDLIVEEMWSALKEHKNPTIDFRRLVHFTNAQVKALCPDIFA